ncbi:MAG: hypothetical protein NC084_03885 [Bacteroides sp.]|nr:hypothetical protein [Eubacterium sp.]MCM1417694.1 hypothetical protein [Roseburia sp.]MCM1461840.1 hypothetical protein [Bacteroides sp.]
MEKVLEFFKNKWIKRAVSILSLGFPAFLVFLDWLAFAYSLEPTNPVPLFLLYMLVNFIFGGLFFYTRKQLATRFAVVISPLLVFILMIAGFGNWYMIVPPFVICFFGFLACGAGETLKTVLGTIYLLMFVVGALVYLTLLHFNLTPQKLLFREFCDLSQRSTDYVYSTEGSYRLVRYIDQKNSDRVTVRYYVEDTSYDYHLWYLDCYRHFDSLKVLVTVRRDTIGYEWRSDTELYIDERVKDIPELFEKQRLENSGEDEDETAETTSAVKKPIVFDDEKEDDPDGEDRADDDEPLGEESGEESGEDEVGEGEDIPAAED